MADITEYSKVTGAALERRLKRLGLTQDEDDWTDRYLLCEHIVDPETARTRQRFESVARFIRDLIAHRWVKTRATREQANPKRVYYLSMEFLVGRALNNNIINISADPLVERALGREGWDLTEILDQEPDAGLGNGGLGRLAACFVDSLATLQYSAMGYGLQYEYGIFKQSVRDGYQVEEPDNWLRQPDPWQIPRPGKEIQVPLSATFELRGSNVHIIPNRPSMLGDEDRKRRMSLVEEEPSRRVRMAHLAVVGTHSTNGVAEIHSDLLRTRVLNDFADMFPERFNNKTNGVTPRRWLLMANPSLSRLITEAIGDGWITDLDQLTGLAALAEDAAFRERFMTAKRQARERFAGWLSRTSGRTPDLDTIFDCQIKRIHEYKRQLLNVLHIVILYNRIGRDGDGVVTPRTFFFAGKAAPAYHLAKLTIKLITSVARTLDEDPAVRGRLRVLFLPDYNVTLAERLIPASDVSQQISTAGYEASGTGNMKFMMNGALTVGTRDGATIEMARQAGEENFFLFGLSAAQVAASRGWYDPHWHYQHDEETRGALDLIFGDHFNRDEPGIFAPIRDRLLTEGDYYMHLADLKSYADTQQRVAALYEDPHAWARTAILNVAHSGRFSSDRTIAEYAADIWNVQPCPVP